MTTKLTTKFGRIVTDKKRLGVTFSGGGVKGASHIGVIKLLDEMGVKPDYIAGTSAGAIVGSLYTCGMNNKDILALLMNVQSQVKRNLLKLAHLNPKKGIINSDKVADIFMKTLPLDEISNSPIEFTAFCTEMMSGTIHAFNNKDLSISIYRAIMASAAYPPVFSPIKVGKAVYSDGGILCEFPADIASARCEKMIGSYATPYSKVKESDLNSAIKVSARALSLQMSSQNAFDSCDVLISPKELSTYNTFKFSKSNMLAAASIGYKEALKHQSKIENLVGEM